MGGEVGVVVDLFAVWIVVIDDTIVGAMADVVFVAVVNFSVGIIEFIEFKDKCVAADAVTDVPNSLLLLLFVKVVEVELLLIEFVRSLLLRLLLLLVILLLLLQLELMILLLLLLMLLLLLLLLLLL